MAPACGLGKGPMGPSPGHWLGPLAPVYVQYSTVQYNTVQYSTVQYSTVQYNISTVQYSTVQYSIVGVTLQEQKY